MPKVPLCPKCQVPLLQDMKGALTADVCPQCGGMLLSFEAWRIVQEDWEAALALENAYADTNPMPILVLEMVCPLCEAVMEPFYPPQAPNLSVDRCPQCGSVWLDDGELGKLVEAMRSHRPLEVEEGAEEPAAVVERVYCAHCGRENFADRDKCWACGEPLLPEAPPLPPPLQAAAEIVSMLTGGTGAIMFGLFVSKPQGEKWAALGLVLMIVGFIALASLRRLWRRGRSTPFFPTYSDQ